MTPSSENGIRFNSVCPVVTDNQEYLTITGSEGDPALRNSALIMQHALRDRLICHFRLQAEPSATTATTSFFDPGVTAGVRDDIALDKIGWQGGGGTQRAASK